MPKNRFSDLTKNISNEGWRVETMKEKNPQELASDQIRCERRRRTVRASFFFWFYMLT